MLCNGTIRVLKVVYISNRFVTTKLFHRIALKQFEKPTTIMLKTNFHFKPKIGNFPTFL